jgi:hypothetical protein
VERSRRAESANLRTGRFPASESCDGSKFASARLAHQTRCWCSLSFGWHWVQFRCNWRARVSAVRPDDMKKFASELPCLQRLPQELEQSKVTSFQVWRIWRMGRGWTMKCGPDLFHVNRFAFHQSGWPGAHATAWIEFPSVPFDKGSKRVGILDVRQLSSQFFEWPAEFDRQSNNPATEWPFTLKNPYFAKIHDQNREWVKLAPRTHQIQTRSLSAT